MVDRLLQTLRILAAGRHEAALPRAHDVALDCADALRLVIDCPQIQLTEEQQVALEELGEQLERVTEARNGTQWESIRRLAKMALSALSENG